MKFELGDIVYWVPECHWQIFKMIDEGAAELICVKGLSRGTKATTYELFTAKKVIRGHHLTNIFK